MRIGTLAMTMVGALGACGPSSPDAAQACTMIGCESGLTVRLGEGFGEPVSVAVSGSGEASRTVRCGADRPCEGGVFFRDFVAESVTIRVTTTAGGTTRTVRPQYRSMQPNGEGCPPTCQQAEVLVSGPGDPSSEAAPSQGSRAPSIVDTVAIEGMPESMPMRLAGPPAGFPISFTTYVPEDWRTEVSASGDGTTFRITPGPAWLEGGLMAVGVELGRRDGRYFHILVRYPAEMGDGMAPRVGAIMRHWRWEPSGASLGG